ncbi:hypothetical protein M5E87_05550 [Flavonifractor plautii]|nr:hypothetical protein M5E87_05550 [Flavonifractor plautii]
MIDSVHFEKVNLDDLELNIQTQISEYVPVMSAPTLAKELLIHHISVLSKGKGYTTLKLWQEKIHEIGTNIAALDGFYKEYNKSLVRLDELQLNGDHKQLEKSIYKVCLHILRIFVTISISNEIIGWKRFKL